MINLRDPASNFAFEVHEYFSGDWDNLTPWEDASKSLVEATQWARANRVEMFLGEWGFAATPEATQEGKELNDYINANADVWKGSTYWSAGPWWGDYPFSVQPLNGADRPQMAVLDDYLLSRH